METINYQDLSVEELDQRLLEISNERDRLWEVAKQITQIRDQKVTLQRAQEKLAAMSPAEREALTRAISL